MASGVIFWAVRNLDGNGNPMWWEKGLKAPPKWVGKLTPRCLFHTKLAADKLISGEGSQYFGVEEGGNIRVAKIHVAEIIFDGEAE